MFKIVKYVVLFAFMMLPFSSYSQQVFPKEKRIYIVDVTASMIGKGIVKTPNIFDKVKEELVAAVRSINDEETEIAIIPFTCEPHPMIKGYANDKDTLISEINKLSIRPGDTNIADAWTKGLEEIDSTRVNYVFLLTDGLHNCGPENDVLYDSLRSWKDVSSGKYYFAFYVMLTSHAKEQEICKIVDETEQMWLIESTDINVLFASTYLTSKVNIYNANVRSLPFRFSNPYVSRYGLNVELELEDNPYYKITDVQSHMEDGYVNFKIEELQSKSQLPIKVELKLRILYNKEGNELTFFTPEVVNLIIYNHGPRIMTIKSIEQ